ncbi:periplasmic heavy metal sensor [bacterium]|nr:periplasmic heavy metal sensor [bacterium]
MNRLLKIALVVSLAFNIAFLIGYFSAPTSAKPTELPDHTADLVQRELGLDMDQRKNFLSLHSAAGARAREFYEATALARQELLAESAKPEPDDEKIATLQEELSRLRESNRELHFSQFQKFMETLTPHQRRAVHEKLSFGHRSHGRRHEHFVREFDEDKDGRLNEEERRRAIETVRKRFHDRAGKDGKEHGKPPFGKFGPGMRPPGPGMWRRPDGSHRPGKHDGRPERSKQNEEEKEVEPEQTAPRT